MMLLTNLQGRFLFLLGLLCAASTPTLCQHAMTDPQYHLIEGRDIVQSKNYYLLTLFQELPEVNNLLKNDPVLSGFAKAKADSLVSSLRYCKKEALCYINSMKFSGEEIKSVSTRLAALYQPGNALGKMVTKHVIPSGAYVLFNQLPAKELLIKAWEQDAAGINFVLGVYAEGKQPNYPLIDSISLVIRDKRDTNSYASGYLSLLYSTVSLASLENKSDTSFFGPSLRCALHFLEMNERYQAADYEPMVKGENNAAWERIKSVKWKDYKYSVILVPGAGPDDPHEELSAEGMLRCRLAALQYKSGVAPFIVTSGGKVHPYKTKYCEATEMKKYLIQKLNIPENAIFIEPHARHTTTNMRNVVRMIYRYGMPFDKPGITCTTRGQSTMIGVTLISRCLKELNEAPYKNGNRLSETEMEFYPLIEALHINPCEPMDP